MSVWEEEGVVVEFLLSREDAKYLSRMTEEELKVLEKTKKSEEERWSTERLLVAVGEAAREAMSGEPEDEDLFKVKITYIQGIVLRVNVFGLWDSIAETVEGERLPPGGDQEKTIDQNIKHLSRISKALNAALKPIDDVRRKDNQ